MTTEKSAVCVEKSFLSMRSCISMILYLKLNTWYLSLYAMEVDLYEWGESIYTLNVLTYQAKCAY